MDPRVEDYLLLRGAEGVDVLRAVGLIAPDDEVPPPPTQQRPVDDAVRATAERWMRERIGSPPPPEEAGEWMHEMSSCMYALRSVGALDRGAYRSLDQELERVPVRWRDEPRGDSDPLAGSTPLAIVVGPPVRRFGWRIMAVELHPAAVAVHYDFARLGPEADGSWPALPDEVERPERTAAWIDGPSRPLRLTDDLGTAYVSAYGGPGTGATADRGAREFSGIVAFTPAAPPGARRLPVLVGDDPIEVPLPA